MGHFMQIAMREQSLFITADRGRCMSSREFADDVPVTCHGIGE